MTLYLEIGSKKYCAQLSSPLDISIPLAEGEDNPNCYFAEPVRFETISSGDFIGSVKEGGSVNYKKLTVTPHGNGTHTECYGHISSDESVTINKCLQQFHFVAQVITVEPAQAESGDRVIRASDLTSNRLTPGIKAIVIRTQPNHRDKIRARYSNTNPPYFEKEVAKLLVAHGIDHLLVDLPSVDREVDAGTLAAHKAFWNYPRSPRKNATITELIYVPEFIGDGLYLLNLQITSLEMDASPSKPILYKLEEVY